MSYITGPASPFNQGGKTEQTSSADDTMQLSHITDVPPSATEAIPPSDSNLTTNATQLRPRGTKSAEREAVSESNNNNQLPATAGGSCSTRQSQSPQQLSPQPLYISQPAERSSSVSDKDSRGSQVVPVDIVQVRHTRASKHEGEDDSDATANRTSSFSSFKPQMRPKAALSPQEGRETERGSLNTGLSPTHASVPVSPPRVPQSVPVITPPAKIPPEVTSPNLFTPLRSQDRVDGYKFEDEETRAHVTPAQQQSGDRLNPEEVEAEDEEEEEAGEEDMSQTKEWFEALMNGEVDKVKALLEEDVDVNIRNRDGQTGLIVVSKLGNPDIATLLLVREGIDVNAQGSNGETALHLACRMGNVAMASQLLDAGSDVNLALNNGGTALHCACQAAEPELVDALMESGAEVHVMRSGRAVSGITPLHDATEVGNLDIVKTLLDKGIDVDCEDSKGTTPILTASKYGYLDIVKELIQRGAYVAKKGTDSKGVDVQAIHLASENNYSDTILELVQSGCDLGARRTYLGQSGLTALHLAVMKSHLDATKILLQLGHEPSPADEEGFTPLHIAAKANTVDIAEILINSGAQVNFGASSKQSRNQTPLHYATRQKNHNVVRLLLDNGADVNASENMPMKPSRKSQRLSSEQEDAESPQPPSPTMVPSYTALHWAAENGDVAMVQLLLSFDADINKNASFECHTGVTALHLASQDGYTDVVTELLTFPGCDKNPKKSTYNRESITPLHQAVYNGHSTTSKALVENGADVNIQADNGYAALHYATQQGNLDITKFLLDHGARVNLRAAAKNQLDLTPLHLAVQSGNTEVVHLLAKAGSELNAKKTMGDVQGVTPLHQAVYQEKLEVVQVLLRLGCDVGMSMEGWYSPLHIAAERGSKEILIELLRHKADINQIASHEDHKDVTPLHVASQHGHSEIVRFLLSGAADIEAKRSFVDRSSMTPLHLASENGFVETVSALCQMGADVNGVDSLGFTALHLAVQYGFPEVVEELLHRGASLKQKTQSGLTPCALAEQMGNSKLAARLKEEKKRRTSEKRRSFSPRGLRGGGSLRALLCGMNKS